MYDYYSPYDYYGYGSSSSSSLSNSSLDSIGSSVSSILASFSLLIILACIISIIVLIAKWKLFKKAGKKPWESLIPVHSDIVELEMGGIESYWWFLNLVIAIPFIGWFFGWIAPVFLGFWKSINLAKAFGKTTGFGVLMAFFPYVCYPILAFGNAQYVGPQKSNATPNATVNYEPVQQPAQPAQPTQPTQPFEPTQNNDNNNVPPQQ